MLILITFVCLVANGCDRRQYSWSDNGVIAPFSDSRQQAETALVTDSKGRIWLSFIDAEYRRVQTGMWIAMPRTVRLFVSDDEARTFRSESPLSSDSAGDEALAVAPAGYVYASFVHYMSNPSRQEIVVRRLDVPQSPPVSCLPWDAETKHDQSNIHVGKDGIVYVVGMDIRAKPHPGGALLFGKSTDGGKSFVAQNRMPGVGPLPQVVDTEFGLLIAGPIGFYISTDQGVLFSKKNERQFADKLVRVAVSPDRRTAYVVGDSTGGGLQIHATRDGKNWRTARVDDAARAISWRFPAVHVDRKNHVHVVWMDNRDGSGAVYHAFSEDGGAKFSPSTRVSDKSFPFPASAPAPPPATQEGTWVGDYLSLTTLNDLVVVAWSDQRAGTPKSVVQVAVGSL